MIGESKAENTSTAAGKEHVGSSDIIAAGGEVYRILSHRGDSNLFVDVENIETFERVLLTTAVIPAPMIPVLRADGDKARRRGQMAKSD